MSIGLFAPIQKMVGAIGKQELATFRKKLDNPAEIQEILASEITQDFRNTEYGHFHGLGSRSTGEAFRTQLPITSWSGLERWIDRQIELPTEEVLFSTPVLFTEGTSGSGGAVKRIPFTSELLRTFSTMAKLWVTDIARNGPHFKAGRFFLSLSPPALIASGSLADSTLSTPSNDSEYLGGWAGTLLRPFIVQPRGLGHVTSMEDYRSLLSLALLSEPRLEAVALWNPSYFTTLLKFMEDRREHLVQDLRRGYTEM